MVEDLVPEEFISIKNVWLRQIERCNKAFSEQEQNNAKYHMNSGKTIIVLSIINFKSILINYGEATIKDEVDDYFEFMYEKYRDREGNWNYTANQMTELFKYILSVLNKYGMLHEYPTGYTNTIMDSIELDEIEPIMAKYRSWLELSRNKIKNTTKEKQEQWRKEDEERLKQEEIIRREQEEVKRKKEEEEKQQENIKKRLKEINVILQQIDMTYNKKKNEYEEEYRKYNDMKNMFQNIYPVPLEYEKNVRNQEQIVIYLDKQCKSLLDKRKRLNEEQDKLLDKKKRKRKIFF